MNSSKAKKGGNPNRGPANFSRRSKFSGAGSSQERNFKDWGRGQPQVVEQPKPQTVAGSTIHCPLASLLGYVAHVFLVDGVVIEGVLKSVSNGFELCLKACSKEPIEAFQQRQKSENTQFVRKDIIPQLCISFSDVVNIQIVDGDTAASSDSGFQVDTSISEFSGFVKEKMLTPWQPAPGDTGLGPLDGGLGHQSMNGWDVEDMLQVNTNKFGVKSTFDSSLSSYMTPIDKENPKFEELQRDAARLAREMEGEHTFKERDTFDSGVGEEEAFSAVRRPGKDNLPPVARGRGVRPSPHSQRPMQGRDPGGQPSSHLGREQPKPNANNTLKKNGVAGPSAPPTMQLSYSDKVKRSCAPEQHSQLSSSLRGDVLPPVVEDPCGHVKSPTAHASPTKLPNNHELSIERGKDIFNKQKSTYSKFGREVPSSRSTNDNSQSDLNDLRKFQSIQIQPGTDSKGNAKSTKRDATSVKKDELSTTDSSVKGDVSLDQSKQSATVPSNGIVDLEVIAKGNDDGGSPAAQSADNVPEKKNVAKTSTLNPNAKEFRLNPNAVEFIPKPLMATSPSLSPMPQPQPDMMAAAYQMQPQHIQLSQQQQISMHLQQQQQQQQHFFNPHAVVVQSEQQRHLNQQPRKTRAMGQQQQQQQQQQQPVVFSVGPDYNGGAPTTPLAPYYTQGGQFMPSIPGGIPIQPQGVMPQSYGDGRPHVYVGPVPHHYGNGQMLIPIAQQPNMPPGGVPVRNPGNPNAQFIRYGGIQMVGSMPTSQAYVPGQPMQNYSPMN